MPIILTSILTECQKLSNVEGPLGVYVWCHAYGNTTAIGNSKPLAAPIGGPNDVAALLGISAATVRRAWKGLKDRFDIQDGYFRPKLDAWTVNPSAGFVKIGGDALSELCQLVGKKHGMSAFRMACALMPRLSRLAHKGLPSERVSNSWLCSHVAGNRQGSTMSRSSIAGAFELLNSAGLLNSQGNPRTVSLFSFLLKDRSKLSTMCGKLCGKLRKTIKAEPAPMIKTEPPLTIYIGNVEERNTGKAGIACLFQSLTWTDLIMGTDSVWVLPPHIDPSSPVLPGLKTKTAMMLASYCENDNDVRRWLMQEHQGLATATNPIGFIVSAVDKWGSRPGKRSELHRFFEKKAAEAGVRTRMQKSLNPEHVKVIAITKTISPNEFEESQTWKSALIQLKKNVDPYDFMHFIATVRGVQTDEGLTIACPDKAHAEWIAKEYDSEISQALGIRPTYKAASEIKVESC